MENKNITIKLDHETKGETTFNKLQNLQTLLKKESALKGLYSSTGKTTEKEINDLCQEIYQKKIDVLNVLKNEKINSSINYQLINNNKEYLKDLYLYIPKLLSYLWENPSILTELLIHSKKDDIKTYLAPLICNNFYENILSPNPIEDQLIFVIYLLLEKEIDQLKDINDMDSFLNDSVCGYLLGELIEKKDIKAFFKIILKDIIEILELSNGDNILLFESNQIEQKLIEKKKKNFKEIKY